MAFPNPNSQSNSEELQTKVFPLSDNDVNHNLNNLDLVAYEQSRKFSLKIQVQLICLAMDILETENARGSTLKDIRHCLCSAGLIDANDDLRRAMVMALKRGLIARPTWALKSGLYGVYVKGDGIPIYAGRKRSKKSDGGMATGRRKRKTKRRKKKDGGGEGRMGSGMQTGGGRGGRRSYSSTDSCRSSGKTKRVRFKRRKRTSKQ